MFSEYIKTVISGIKMWVSAEINATRTHWSETKLVSLVDNKELTFENQDGVYLCLYTSNAFTNVSSGDHLYVVFDDIGYDCVCETLDRIVFCGDRSILESGTAGEDAPPFSIIINPYKLEIATLSSEQTHQISISMMQEIVHKLDIKYLPEIFAKQSDLDTIKATLKNKVDKISGKGLSTNDYTTAEKNKLAGVEPGATKIVVDNSLSTTSINPVQNLTITYALDNKANAGNPECHGSFSLNRKSNTIVGEYSCAEGYNATASGSVSHAEGHNTTASGDYSHAEGYNTTASGDHSHAEGHNTTASGKGTHAEGMGITASGDYSHAEGYGGTTASGEGSHAEGYNTTASGTHSHAEGHSTTASGKNSHASGEGTIAAKFGQCVIGKYNIEDIDTIADPVERNLGKYVFVVGNGYATSRSNAHTLDWSGNAWYKGTVEGKAMVVKSSTAGSSKRFKITVDDTGTISATEVT